MARRDTPAILWPFALLWDLLAQVIGLTGRFVAVVLGMVLMIVGGLLCLTVIGAIVGIPLMIVGFGLIVRGFV
jgi:hypothetical protein